MVGWHHQLDGYDLKQALRVGDGQGSLACCSPWGHKELDTTELDLIDRVPEELWTEVRDTVQDAGIKTIPKRKKCKKAKWLSMRRP